MDDVGLCCAAVLKPEQRQAKRQKIEENRLKKQQLAMASVSGSLSTQMTDDEHELTRIVTDAFIHHLSLPNSDTSQVGRLNTVCSDKHPLNQIICVPPSKRTISSTVH